VNTYAQTGSPFHYAKIQVQSYANNVVVLSWQTYTFNNWQNVAPSRKQTIGTGFTNLKDIIVSNNQAYYYITESGAGGGVYQVPISNSFTKNSAVRMLPFSNSVSQPQQIIQDPVTNTLYVVDLALNRLLSYSPTIQLTTTLATGLSSPTGVAGYPASGPFTSIYFTQTGGVYTLSLSNPSVVTQVVSLVGSKFLRFDPLNSQRLFVTTQNNAIVNINLATSPATQSTVSLSLPSAPADIFPVASGNSGSTPGQFIITGFNYLYSAQLSSSLINGNGPLVLGIGFVPISNIGPNGLATVQQAGYPINVQDSPFGGTLTLLINWQLARSLGYNSYTIQFGGKYQTAPFGDFSWNSASNSFLYVSTSPVSGTNAFPLRNYGQLWLNYWWGGIIDTSGTQGSQTLVVTFGTVSSSTFTPMFNYVTAITVDNIPPTAIINQIYYYNNNVLQPVSACSIVTGTSTYFAFNITASDPDGHLLSYGLGATWGLNAGASVTFDSYSNHVPNPDTGLWYGVTNLILPSSPYWNSQYPGDPSSTSCAHTFYLNVWDRSFNGFSYLHNTGFSESLTFNVGV